MSKKIIIVEYIPTLICLL